MAMATEMLIPFTAQFLDTQEIPRSTAEDVPPHVHIFGNPKIGFLPLAGAEAESGFFAVWTCDRDGFDYDAIPDAEAAFVVDGVLRLTPTDSESTDIHAGEGYRLPAGWSGRVEAIEPVRKVYFLV